METIEGNKLIAEFMGGKFLQPNYPEYVTFKDIEFADLRGDYSCHLNNCYFHSSWSWIMYVLDKIETMVIKTTITTNLVSIRVHERYDTDDVRVPFKANGKLKIEGVWEACIQFIKWYNKEISSGFIKPQPNAK